MAAALGLVAARRGLRTIVAEVARRDDVWRALRGHIGPAHEDELAPGLHHLSIDPEHALEEYLVDQLGSRTAASALASNGAFAALAAAAPGLNELLTIGKVWELAQPDRRTPGAHPYDLVVLDAPATGHGVAILSAPRTFAEIARVGKIAAQGQTIDALVSDPTRTGVVLVTRAEEMPVNETLSLRHALQRKLGLEVELVVANGVLPERFDASAVARLDACHASAPVRAALAADRRARAQREQLDRLCSGLEAPLTSLPFVHAAALEAGHIAALSEALERAL